MDEVEQIRQKIDIVALISEYLPLKKMGRNFKALCPFHSEKTPSFVVSPERQIWHCFGCNIGGDIFTFLMEYEKMEFVEALRVLAKKAGVTLSSRHLVGEGTAKKKERLYQTNHLAAEFYHYLLTRHNQGEGARQYLKSRGITTSSIKLFKLGFAPSMLDGLTRYLTEKKKFTNQELEEAGLVIKSQISNLKSQNYIDRFRSRIMFPLSDHRGNVVGFSGRVLNSKGDIAKYVNTPETLVYHKGELLYGLDLSKEAIKKEGRAILVEGEFDVIQGAIQGISNMVAIKGTALTEPQIALLKRFTDKVSICLDQDQAGISAQWRGIGLLEDKGMLINVIELPIGKDPDECLRKNVKLFHQALKKEIPVYDFLIKSALIQFNQDTTEGKKRISETLLPFFLRIQNEIIKDHYVKKLADAMNVSEESIIKEMDRMGKASTLGVIDQVVKAPPVVQRPRQEVVEEYLLALILQSDQVWASFEGVGKIIDASFLQTPIYQKIFILLKNFLGEIKKNGKENFSIKKFIETIPSELHFTIDRCYLLTLPNFSRETGEDQARLFLEMEKTAMEIKALFLKWQMRNLSLKIKVEESKMDEVKLKHLKEEFNSLLKTLRLLTVSSLPAV